MVNDYELGSCPQLRPGARGSSSKGVKGSHKLRLGSWNIGSLMGKSIDLVKIFKKTKISIACV